MKPYPTPTLHVDRDATPSSAPKYFTKSGTFYKRTFAGQPPAENRIKDWQFQPDAKTPSVGVWVRIERIPNHCQRIGPDALPKGANADKIAAIRAVKNAEVEAEKLSEEKLFSSVRFSTLARIAKFFGGVKRGKKKVSRPTEGLSTHTATATVGANPHTKHVYKKRSI